VRFANGQVTIGAAKTMSFRELVVEAYMARVQLWSDGFYATPGLSWNKDTMQGKPFFYFAYGAAVSEVVVDTLTGEWKLLAAHVLHDAGSSLNPAIDLGQVEGGFIQGMGWLTMEELVWHPNDGSAKAGLLLTHAPSTYKIPTANDCPPVFDVRLWQGGNVADTIHRSKATGEPPLLLPFSVFFAIRDAISAAGGHRLDPPLTAPATSEAILRALTAVQAGERAVIDRTVRELAIAWLHQGRAAVVVEVVRTQGSAPRERGTRMLVSAVETVGTIGGGHLELKAIAAARSLMAGGRREREERHFALGPSLGQCCGGAVTLAFAPLDAEALARWPAAEPLFRLQLHGAGHVGRAIASGLAALDVEVDWFDPRDEEFPATTTFGSPWPGRIRQVAVDTIEAEVRHAPPGAFFLVLTHEHALDLRIVEAILGRGDFAFCGLIGSKTKRARFVRRLEERGIRAERIARLPARSASTASPARSPR
jgi:xanthine dehydrogenase accessory protein XdhC